MSELLLAYVVTATFVCVLSSLFVVYRYFLGNKLIQQADKLKSQMANLRRDFPEIGKNPKAVLGEGLEQLGVDGIMNELGIDPTILRNPLVKGLVEKYAPRLLETLQKGTDKGSSAGPNLL